MKELLKTYKGVLRFILIFIGSYILLSVFYSLYLNASEGSKYYPDYVTHLVAKQSTELILSFGYNAEVLPNKIKPNMNLFVNGKHVAQIIEGCNAISIIILFCAFVLAFKNTFKKTILFLFVGVVLLFAINLVRIAILAIALYEYPEQKQLLHDVVFPGLIYGMVFFLWMFWVRITSKTEANE